jgi:hypothetical protein
MKKFISNFICIGCILAMGSCNEDRIKARPDEIIPTTIPPAVFQKLMEQLPGGQNARTALPALFEANAEKQVVLTKESEVYVTYVDEDAGYNNTFGWYSYNAGARPTTASEIKMNVLFPTVSKSSLKQGDMLQLGNGKFPAGTVIGFFLIIRGWENGAINYGNETFYTDIHLNPNGSQQHVLFKQKDLGDVILAFEDELSERQSDEDFNDILFTVTDNRNGNEVSSFDVSKVIKL